MSWHPHELRSLLRRSQQHRFERDEYLFREGDPGERVYLIRQGTVEIWSESGHSPILLAQRRKGEIIGEMALLDSGIRGASARARTVVVVRSLDKETFESMLSEHPELTLKVTQLLTQRMRSMQNTLVPHDSPEPRVGQPFGPYLLLHELGRGGAGVVYEALERSTQRLVAVKLISESSPDTQQRFKLESSLLHSLSHPAIVTTYDSGGLGRYLYLAMELLRGETLHDRLRYGPLPWNELREWFTPVMEALHYAHERSIAHRDIKPANLMRTRDGQVKLLDFGLARNEESPHITTQGKFLGTPHYFAPERLGDPSHTPPWSERVADQYSLGATLFHAVAGHTVFRESDPMVVLVRHLNSPPPALRKVRSDCPAELEAFIERLLCKDPRARFASLAQALECWEQLPWNDDSRGLPSEDRTLEF